MKSRLPTVDRTSETQLQKRLRVFAALTSSSQHAAFLSRSMRFLVPVLAFACIQIAAGAAEKNAVPRTTSALPAVFNQAVKPILNEYCVTCHSTEKQKGDLDLERFKTFDEIKSDPAVWEHA